MTKSGRVVAAVSVVCVLSASSPAAIAGAKTKAFREVIDYIMKMFGKEAVKEGGEEALATRLEALVAKRGGEVLEAAKASGPRGIRALEEVGEHDSGAAVQVL